MARTGNITNKIIEGLRPPGAGHEITWDKRLKGFGVRITSAGTVSFVVDYRIDGRQRRMTLGRATNLSAIAARDRAREALNAASAGNDPLEHRQSRLRAPTVEVLADRYLRGHATTKQPQGAKEDAAKLKAHILPKIGKRKVAEVRSQHIYQIINALKDRPYQANRVMALLSKMFSIAVEEGWISKNPVAGIKRSPEEKRDRWLTPEEIQRVVRALREHPNRAAAHALMLLLLTGARKSEVLKAEWSEFDLRGGTWTKPSHHTKQKKAHRVPLNPYAVAVLNDMRAAAGSESYLFPGAEPGTHLQDVKRCWRQVREAAHINNVRIHDLRHTFASLLVSRGESLPVVGALLGHTQPITTQRYAHLSDKSQQEATNVFGEIVEDLAQ